MLKKAEVFFNNIKIRNKLLISYAVISFFSIVIMSITAYYLSSMHLRNQTYTYTKKSIAQINKNIDNNLKSMDDLCILLSYNEDVQYYFKNYNKMTLRERYDLEYKIESYLINLASINSFAANITISSASEDIFIQSSSDQYNPIDDSKRLIHEKMINSQKDKVIFSNVEKGNQGNYYYARKIRLLGKGTFAGVVSVGRNIDEINELTKFLEFEKESVIKITDQEGQLVYLSEPEGLDEKQLKYYMAYESEQNTEQEQRIGNIKTIVSSYTSEYSKWITTYYIPVKFIDAKAKDIMNAIVWLSAVSFIIFIIIALFISKGISKPLSSIVQEINQVKDEHLDTRLNYERKDEIGQLALSFNAMLERIEFLITSVYQATIDQKDAEMRALQAQINPHFLYNTLESIRTLAVLNDDYDVSDMITALGKYFRSIISNKNMLHTVKEEKEHITNYMLLMKLKFRNMEFHIDMEEEILDQMIIKLLIQPLIENSLRHGFGKPEMAGKIVLSGYTDGQSMYFKVSDTGRGMKEDCIKELQIRLEENQSENGQRIGLINVNHRLKTYYGTNSGITVASKENETAVIVKIPLNYRVDG